MAVRYYGLLDHAKAGLDQFRIQLEYKPKWPEPLINGDLGIATTKSAEIVMPGVWGYKVCSGRRWRL